MATKDRTTLKDEFKNGNLATGERFADLIDSMKVVQLPVVDPQALGTSLSFIDSISQDADGKITATKKRMSPTVGSFKFVANDTTAEAAFTAIGAKYSGAISGVSPSADTLGVILLMNDDDTTPTKTMMITTEEVTPATNPATYQFVYVGDLQSALPSGLLTVADIVNGFTGGVDKVLSAEAGRKIAQNVTAVKEQLVELVRVAESDLTLLGNGYMDNATKKIVSWANAILYYYPVSAYKTYKLSSNLAWSSNYAVFGFKQEIPTLGTVENPVYCDETIKTSDTPFENYEYTPQSNGYLILCYRDNRKAYIDEENTISISELKDTLDDVQETQTQQEATLSGLSNRVSAIEDKFSAYVRVAESDLTLLGNGYMGNATKKIVSWANAILYYYPVSAYKTYKLSSNLAWSSNYAVFGFKQEIPTLGTVDDPVYCDETIKTSDTPFENYEYTPQSNGYLILCYRDNRKAYIDEPETLDISIAEMNETLNDVENDVEVIKATQGVGVPPLKRAIVCSGSSITWGGGHLDDSMVGVVDDFLKNNFASTVLANSSNVVYSTTPEDITNWLLYKSLGKKISGLNETVEFDLFGDEIAICQAKRRSTDYGIMEVYADNVKIGTFDNKNSIGSDDESFTGNSIVEVRLKHPCTFNHAIYINGSSTPLSNVVINENSATMPSGCDAWVFRSNAGYGATCHYIRFASSLGTITSVRVLYSYGRFIAHERSTVGQTSNEYTNEYVYGKGSVSFDPAQPSAGINSGLEFRAIDERAFFVHKFSTSTLRHYKIKIVGGSNPYFIFNFATNRYHNLMNAGIGGWEVYDLMYGNINQYTQFFKYWKPDVIFEEACTNDDWKFPTRRISRSIGEVSLADLQKMHQLEVHKITYNSETDKYAVEMCTGIISAITPTSLTSSDIIGTETQVGDIIRIGNYHGDMQQVTCRKITEVNLETGVVRWNEPLTVDSISMIEDLSELVGAEINIRNLDTYKSYYVELITKIHAISPATKIVVVENGLPNLWTRQLWGYDIIHSELANEYSNVEYLNVRKHILDTMNWTISGDRTESVTSTGNDTYDLSFAGSQYHGWQGFKVLVNGVDVYGKDAYVEMAMAYRIKNNITGAGLDKTDPYDRTNSDWVTNGVPNLVLHFIKNVPTTNDTIEVQFADELWSNDFCHLRTDLGCLVYGEPYVDMLKKL